MIDVPKKLTGMQEVYLVFFNHLSAEGWKILPLTYSHGKL